jgi:hypothetical protein
LHTIDADTQIISVYTYGWKTVKEIRYYNFCVGSEPLPVLMASQIKHFNGTILK